MMTSLPPSPCSMNPVMIIEGHSMIDYTFDIHDDGQVFITVPNLEIMSEALNDAISSLPPRGDATSKPSTYWIDHALSRLDKDERHISGGNCTILSLTKRDNIRAEYDYDGGKGRKQEIPRADFRRALMLWRALVISSAQQSTANLPETYRRNPHSHPHI